MIKICVCQIKSSEVSMRGILVSITSTSASFGPVLVYLMSNLTAWRDIALYFCVLQVVVTIILFCVSNRAYF